jgi:hypothetical protein
MKTIKNYCKLCIGAAVLILAAVLFFMLNRSANLENGNMKNWLAAGTDARIATAKILSGTDENNDLVVSCMNKISELPDSGDMAVTDAASLCVMGIQLRDNI